MRINAALLFLFLIFFAGCGRNSSPEPKKDFPVLEGVFLGEKLPGDTVRLFAPGIISTGMNERDAAFVYDGEEMFYTVFAGDRYMIMHTEQVNGAWSSPEVASFSGEYNDAEPIFTATRKGLYFISNRPVGKENKDPMDFDIWYTYKTLEGWSEPVTLGSPVNTGGVESFPSSTRDGTLYFSRNPIGANTISIYRALFKDGKFSEPEPLPETINAGGDAFNACIAPDESYLIFSSYRAGGFGGSDYYITYRDKNGDWSEPENMGTSFNTEGDEISPHITPGGKYFFFSSTGNPLKIADSEKIELIAGLPDSIRFPGQQIPYSIFPLNGSSDIYWVETHFFLK